MGKLREDITTKRIQEEISKKELFGNFFGPDIIISANHTGNEDAIYIVED